MSDDTIESTHQLIHNARGSLNRISMNSELIKLILENDMPKDKAIQALDKVILATQECSDVLQVISDNQT